MTRLEAAPDAAAQDEITAVTAICHPQITVRVVPFHIYNNVFRPANNILQIFASIISGYRRRFNQQFKFVLKSRILRRPRNEILTAFP